jgi:hypothetical protein
LLHINKAAPTHTSSSKPANNGALRPVLCFLLLFKNELILMPMATIITKMEDEEAVIRYSYECPAAVDRDNHPGPNGTLDDVC